MAYSPLVNLLGDDQITLVKNVSDLYTYSDRAHSIVRVAAVNDLSLHSVTFDNNWIADTNSYPEDSQSNAITI